MKKKLLSLLLLGGLTLTAGAQNAFHPFDGTFDNEWVDCVPWQSTGNDKAFGTEPSGWCVSNVPNSVMPTVGSKVTGYSNSGLKLENVSVMGQSAPGYLTLGTSWATAETKNTDVRNADGGSFGGISFEKHPDAVRVKYLRDASKGTEHASVVAYTWSGSWSQADVPGNTAVGVIFDWGTATKCTMENRDRNILGMQTSQGGTVTSTNGVLVAKAESYITTTGNETWETKVAEFDYGQYKNQEGVNVDMLNIIISCNDYFADRTAVVSGNTLTIDDVELLYYHGLESVTYNGTTKTYSTYEDVNTVQVDFSDVAYDAAASLTWVRRGQGATVTPSTYDEENAQLTIRVTAEDYDANDETRSNQYTDYVLQFKKPVVTNYTNALTVSINGQTTAPQSETIQLIEEPDGTFTFVLKNFVLKAGNSAMPIGNITLTNITKEGNNISAQQNAEITEGDDPTYAGQWFGPQLVQMGDIPVDLSATIQNETTLLAEIEIDLMNMIQQVINVVFAPVETYTDGKALSLNTGLKNVVLDRSFPAGWSTICLPFATTPSAFTWADANENTQKVNVQRFSSVDNNALSFSALGETEQMEANTPYLIYFPQAKSSATYFGTTVAENTPVPVTNGDYTFTGSYEALMNMEGLYGVADKDGVQRIMKGLAGSTLKATRAYFKTDNQSNVSGMRIRLEGEGDVTAIDGVQVLSGSCDVYNLQGLRVRTAATSLEGLTPGVYVVNGKKVLVK